MHKQFCIFLPLKAFFVSSWFILFLPIFRGVYTRRFYVRLLAAYRIGVFYRKHKMRKYVRLLEGTFG